jgi:hypothetical protein
MNFIKLVLKEFFFIFIDFSKLFLKFKVKEIEVLFFHRDIPFSPGYGAGTYVPLIASKKKKIFNIGFRSKNFNNKNFNKFINFGSYIIMFFFLKKFLNKNYSAHIFNQPNMNLLVSLIKKDKKNKKIIIEIRSPLINSKDFIRKKDFNNAALKADLIIAPSRNIIKSWSISRIANYKYVEIPVCIPKTKFSKRLNIPRNKYLNFIYSGSLNKKRQMDNILQTLNLFSKNEKRFKFYFTTSQKKKLRKRYQNLKFINEVKSNLLHKVLRFHHFGLSYIPPRKNKIDYLNAMPTKILDYAAAGLILICNDHPSHKYIKSLGFKIFTFKSLIEKKFVLSIISDQKKLIKIINHNKKIVTNFFWENYKNEYHKIWQL